MKTRTCLLLLTTLVGCSNESGPGPTTPSTVDAATRTDVRRDAAPLGSGGAGGGGGAGGVIAADAAPTLPDGSSSPADAAPTDTASPRLDGAMAFKRTSPSCGAMTHPSPNPVPTAQGTGECDSIGTSLDFEPDVGRKSGMPTSRILAGSGFGDTEINQCRPYCYRHNFAIGLDMLGDRPDSQKNELVLTFDKPAPFLNNQFFLIWFFLDAQKEPAGFKGFKVKAFLINDRGDKTYIPDDKYLADSRLPPNYRPTGPAAVKPIRAGGFYELKVPSLGVGFGTPPATVEHLTNVVGIGLSVEPAAPLAPGEVWNGRLYIDHARYGTSRP